MKNQINTERPQIDVEEMELNKLFSAHGLARTMERAEKDWAQAVRMIRNARVRGKTIEELDRSEQRRCISHARRLKWEGMTEPRVYCGYLFIFSASGCLITMYDLPKKFGRKRIYDGKILVRDVRKYNRLNAGKEKAADDESAA